MNALMPKPDDAPSQPVAQPGLPQNALMPQAPQASPARPQGPVYPQNAAANFQAQNFTPTQLAKQADVANYSTQELMKLLKNPDVDAKDVISATGDAVAASKITATEGVQFLTGIPPDPKALRPWLDQLLMHNLASVVHLKAMQMQQGGGAPPMHPQPQPTPQLQAAGAPGQ